MKHMRFLSVATITILVFAMLPAQVASAAAACSITWTNQNDWGTGATIDVKITNTGDTAYNGWNITWTFAGNQTIANMWNATYTQTGTALSAKNVSSNAVIAANGGSTNFGFNINYTGVNPAPTSFTVNGVTCGSSGGATSTSLPGATPTRTATIGIINTPTRTATVGIINTPTRTATVGITNTPTRTATVGITNTPTRTATVGVINTPTSTGTAAATNCGSLAICDGFENQTVGAVPSGSWQMIYPDCQGTGTATVDSAQAHSGAKSIRVDGKTGYCNHVFFGNTTSVAGIGPVVYGRIFIRASTALGVDHITFMAMKDVNDSSKNLRFGGQGQVMAWNRESDDATVPSMSPVGISTSSALPINQWSCLEIKVDGTNGYLQAWLNGTAIAGLTVDGVSTADIDAAWNTRANWRPSLSDLKFGWESYSSGNNTLWFDDIAFGASRIGCGT